MSCDNVNFVLIWQAYRIEKAIRKKNNKRVFLGVKNGCFGPKILPYIL